jgi:hypothetical protein
MATRTVTETFCPECKEITAAATDSELRAADEVGAVEADEPCPRCQEPEREGVEPL